LFGGAAATAGGLLVPNAVVAREKIEVSATPKMIESLRDAGDDAFVVHDAASIPDDFFEMRTNLYRRWWAQASPTIWCMRDDKYNAFIEAHVKVNQDFGILVQLEEGPHKELDAGMLTPYPGEP
jgi:hypothetical protein